MSKDKYTNILDVAYERFLHYGITKTTMRDIAEDLNVSASNLYRYFNNKNEIVLAIAKRCREEQDKVTSKIVSNQALTPPQKLEQFLLEKYRYTLTLQKEQSKAQEILSYIANHFPERIISWQNSLENNILSILEEGVISGHFKIENLQQSARMLRIATTHFFLPDSIKVQSEAKEEDLRTFVHWYLSFIVTKESIHLK